MLNLFNFEQSNIKKIIIITIILIFTDLSYLYLIKNLFQEQIIKIQNQKMQFRFIGAIICYLLLVFGLYYFIIKHNKSPFDAFLFGLIIYGVYDSTNYATLINWSPKFAIIDTLWGAILFAFTTYVTYKLI
jgi:uncharacterized membrane protein